MENIWIELIAGTVPQFLFAIVLFWLCQRNADSQRVAYQEQIKTLYDMLSQMLSSVARAIDLMEKKDPKSN